MVLWWGFGVGPVLGEGLPSRLRLAPPTLEAGRVVLDWDVPGEGWSFEVEEAGDAGSAWIPSPGGVTGMTRRWLDPRVADASSRLFRVISRPPMVERGRLISAERTATYSIPTLTFMFAFGGVPVTPQHEVEVYRLVYQTVDPWGLPTRASAALAVPRREGRIWPLLAYQHGTITAQGQAPSAASSTEGLIGVVLASSGYASVLSDLLGFGESRGNHPYHHAASTATAVVDGLRAGRSWCGTNGVPLNGQLFLAGYSQGGHATLAVLRELEARHVGEFAVTACSAMAGAYDLSGVTLDDALSDRRPPNGYYFAYLLQTMVDLYQLAPALGDLLRPPYSVTIPPLMTVEGWGGAVNAALPAVPHEALEPGFLAAIRGDPEHPLRRSLRDNDVTGFVPRAPLRLYHCSGDQDVVPQNSVVARDRFVASGAGQVEMFDPQVGADHGDCVQPALLATKSWFDSLRQ
jgi:hypothetical protein